jgi:hypothetical protein
MTISLLQEIYTTTAPTYTYPIFDTFWNNEGLRATLWPNLPLEPIPQAIKDLKKIDFINKVISFDPSFYSFINVK